MNQYQFFLHVSNLQRYCKAKGDEKVGNIYEEIVKFEEKQRAEVRKEKKKRKIQVCIDPDSVIGKEIMYQTALLHEILNEVRGGKSSS